MTSARHQNTHPCAPAAFRFAQGDANDSRLSGHGMPVLVPPPSSHGLAPPGTFQDKSAKGTVCDPAQPPAAAAALARAAVARSAGLAR